MKTKNTIDDAKYLQLLGLMTLAEKHEGMAGNSGHVSDSIWSEGTPVSRTDYLMERLEIARLQESEKE